MAASQEKSKKFIPDSIKFTVSEEEFRQEILLISNNLLKNLATISSESKWPEEIKRQFKSQLGIEESEEVTLEKVIEKITPIVKACKDLDSLRDQAVIYLNSILQGRKKHLSDEEISQLGAYFAVYTHGKYLDCLAGEVNFFGIILSETFIRASVGIPGFEYVSEICDFRVPRPFFLGYPPEQTPFLGLTVYINPAGIRKYPRYDDKDPSFFIEKALEEKGKIRVLDIGRGSNFFLDEVKKKYGNKVYTIGVGVENNQVIDKPSDEDFVGPAEILPDEWAGSINFITSCLSFRYFLYPDIALSEVLRVLSVGGEAILEVYGIFAVPPERYYDLANKLGFDLKEVIAEHYSKFDENATTIELVNDLAKEQGVSVEARFSNGYLYIKKLS